MTSPTSSDFAAKISEKHGSDVLVFSGALDYPSALAVVDACSSRRRRRRVHLFLCTFGGQADAAFQIGRCLQRSYDHITVVINGLCKSAGTLLALCADELVVSDYGELGPLDVQIRREDEVGERRSGMTPKRALISLQTSVMHTFQEHFLRIREDFQISTKLAAEITSSMAVGLFKEIYSQIDPMRLGEIESAMEVADAYGRRLSARKQNVKPEAISRLLAKYPDHGFVIDREEAKEHLFKNVREPDDVESGFLGHIPGCMRLPETRAVIEFFGPQLDLDRDDKTTEASDGTGNSEADRGDHAEAGSAIDGASRANGDGAEKGPSAAAGAEATAARTARTASTKGATRLN